MRKTAMSMLALLMALALLMGGCVTSAPTPAPTTAPTTAPTAASATTVEPAATPEPTPAPRFPTAGKLIYYVTYCDYPDAPTVFAKVNESLQAELNTTVDFKTISTDNYNVMLSSGEAFDMIGVADWLGFWDFAAKGAFAELTDDMIAKDCPNITAKYPKGLDVNKMNGKRYAIPAFGDNVISHVWVVRGDLMDKYGIKKIDKLDDLGAYLEAVHNGEKDIIPYATNYGWRLPSIFYNEMGWTGIGDATVMIDMVAQDYKLFDPLSRPETLEFAKKMKTWGDHGYWSKSALSSKVSDYDAFKQGKSALTSGNLDQANALFKEVNAANPSWNIRMYNAYTKFSNALSNNGSGVAVSSGCKDIDRALAVIDLLKANKTLNQLIMHGIEGKHYQVLPDNMRLPLDDKGYSWSLNGLDNNDYFLYVGGGFSNAGEVLKNLKATVIPNKLLNFTFIAKPVEQQATALQEAGEQYYDPLFLGLVDDVDKSYQEFVQKRKDAGLDAYLAELQKQADAYLATQK